MSAGVDNPSPARRRGPRTWFRDMRVSRKLLIVIAVHLLHAAILLVVTAYGMKALSASRAYVEGEGLWSKAQKEGTLHLVAYADSGNVSHYELFLADIDVTLGDRQAREEMDKGDPDRAVIRDGFLRGKIHPDDIQDMVWLYRNFGNEPHLAKAIAIWAEADGEIESLLAIGDRLQEAVATGDAAAIAALKSDVYDSDARLTVLEDDFSRDLGDGVRWLTGVVTVGAIGLTIVFVGLAFAISATAARQITRSLKQLNDTAQAVASGDLDRRVAPTGADEVAAVGRTFDAMAQRLSAMLAEVRGAADAKATAAAQAREIERLGELDAFRTEFINTASHELRTPLTPLRAQLHVLALRLGDAATPELKRSVEIARRNVERLSSLVEDLLEVSRYQAGRMVLQPKPSDVHAIVRDAAETFLELAKARGVTLDVAVSGSGTAAVDAKRVSQVLYNLLSNALKFTPSGGRVQVRSTGDEAGVTVVVADDGLGIAADALGRLFQPFSQVHEAAVEHPGSGLGLYICRAIVELHGGTITAASAGRGKGTTFTVRLPRQQPGATAAAA